MQWAHSHGAMGATHLLFERIQLYDMILPIRHANIESFIHLFQLARQELLGFGGLEIAMGVVRGVVYTGG